jgi:hypothetical protein
MRVTQAAAGAGIVSELTPARGTALVSLKITGRVATACFTDLGGSPPCIRIEATDAGTQLRPSADGLSVDSGTGRIDLLVTATTAGGASVGLGLLDPAELVDAHDVGAALLWQPDPAYAARLERLVALGFREARAFGAYQVLLRSASQATP